MMTQPGQPPARDHPGEEASQSTPGPQGAEQTGPVPAQPAVQRLPMGQSPSSSQVGRPVHSPVAAQMPSDPPPTGM